MARPWADIKDAGERDEALPAGQAPLGRQPDPLQDHRRGRHVGIYGRRPADRRKRRLQCRDGGGSLYALYASGIVSTPKAPTALYSMTGNINDCSVLIHFFDSYDVANKKGSGLIPWAMIDIIAQSGDPTHYVKSSANAASTETANLVADFLALQTANGTGAFIAADNTNDKKDGIMSNITYTLAMDMYFDGGDWSNENEAGTAGRTAAFNYLLSRPEGRQEDRRPFLRKPDARKRHGERGGRAAVQRGIRHPDVALRGRRQAGQAGHRCHAGTSWKCSSGSTTTGR